MKYIVNIVYELDHKLEVRTVHATDQQLQAMTQGPRRVVAIRGTQQLCSFDEHGKALWRDIQETEVG